MDLNGIIGADIVLINSLQPTNIIVRVRYQMNIKLPMNNALRSIVNHILGFHRVQNNTQNKNQ